jgi:hypothetical protein
VSSAVQGPDVFFHDDNGVRMIGRFFPDLPAQSPVKGDKGVNGKEKQCGNLQSCRFSLYGRHQGRTGASSSPWFCHIEAGNPGRQVASRFHVGGLERYRPHRLPSHERNEGQGKLSFMKPLPEKVLYVRHGLPRIQKRPFVIYPGCDNRNCFPVICQIADRDLSGFIFS